MTPKCNYSYAYEKILTCKISSTLLLVYLMNDFRIKMLILEYVGL